MAGLGKLTRRLSRRRTRQRLVMLITAMTTGISVFLFMSSFSAPLPTLTLDYLQVQVDQDGPGRRYGSDSSRLHGQVPERGSNKTDAPNADPRSHSFNPLLKLKDNMTRLEEVIHSLELIMDDESSWTGSSYFQPRASVVTLFKPEVLIDSVRCPSRGPYVLLLIPCINTGLNSVNTRNAIRRTWASPAYGAAWPNDTRHSASLLQVVFFLGVNARRRGPDLWKESRKYRDIVQLDFEESYRNLSLKMGLAVEWSVRRCPGADHVVKVDTDTFVDLPFLLDVLQRLPGLGFPHFVLGFHHNMERPLAIRSGRWGVANDLYPFLTLPRYVFGHSYVLSARAARKLGAVWRHMPLLPNEDAFLTGVLAKAAGIPRIHCDWFALEYNNSLMAPREELLKGRSISQTGFKPWGKLYDMWRMVQKAYGGEGTIV